MPSWTLSRMRSGFSALSFFPLIRCTGKTVCHSCPLSTKILSMAAKPVIAITRGKNVFDYLTACINCYHWNQKHFICKLVLGLRSFGPSYRFFYNVMRDRRFLCIVTVRTVAWEACGLNCSLCAITNMLLGSQTWCVFLYIYDTCMFPIAIITSLHIKSVP